MNDDNVRSLARHRLKKAQESAAAKKAIEAMHPCHWEFPVVPVLALPQMTSDD